MSLYKENNLIYRSKEVVFNEDGSVKKKVLESVLSEHNTDKVNRLIPLNKYYKGQHKILEDDSYKVVNKENRVVINLCKIITDYHVDYGFSIPITYNNLPKDLEDFYTIIDDDSYNIELAYDQSKYGIGYRLIQMEIDEEYSENLMPYPLTCSPLNTFVVFDNARKNKVLFGVRYSSNLKEDGSIDSYTILVYTNSAIYEYKSKSFTEINEPINVEPHDFKICPIIPFLNNKDGMGDYEQLMTQNDLYNLLESTRSQGELQTIDSLLLISGFNIGDNEEQMVNTINFMNKYRVLPVPSGDENIKNDAKFINRPLQQSETEVFKKALKEDIYTGGCYPDLNNKENMGNLTGVALKVRMQPANDKADGKARYFKQGLRKQFLAISNAYGEKHQAFNVADIDIHFHTKVIEDKIEKLQILQGEEGIFSNEYRKKKYDPECDIEEDNKKLQEEQKEKANIMSMAFNPNQNPKDDINAIKENANKQEELDSDENNNSKKDKDEELDEMTNVENSKNNKKKK